MLAFAAVMDGNPKVRSKPLVDYIEDLQARGRYTFTRSEVISSQVRSKVALDAALRRLKMRGRIAIPRRGFYVLVPLEYREARCPPAGWFVDELMHFLGQPYYVGLLSAAAIHGAAHQQPMVFHVITDRPTRPIRAGRIRLEFHTNRGIQAVPVVQVQTETGSMRVSSVEATAYDLVRFPKAAGHLSNVATVLRELSEKLNAVTMAELADAYAVPDVQRIGYILETSGQCELTGRLATWLSRRRYRPILLAPGRPRGGKLASPKWRIIPNEFIESDL